MGTRPSKYNNYLTMMKATQQVLVSLLVSPQLLLAPGVSAGYTPHRQECHTVYDLSLHMKNSAQLSMKKSAALPMSSSAPPRTRRSAPPLMISSALPPTNSSALQPTR